MMILCSDYLLDIAMTWIIVDSSYWSISYHSCIFGDKFRHLGGQVPPNRAFPAQPHLRYGRP